MSNALTIVPSGVPISAPSYSHALDFELELGVVLGAPLRDATVEQATAAIAAVVVVNDFSARDVQLPEMRSGFGPQKSKHFVTSMSSTAVAGAAVRDRLDRLTANVVINGTTVSKPARAACSTRSQRRSRMPHAVSSCGPASCSRAEHFPAAAGWSWAGGWLRATSCVWKSRASASSSTGSSREDGPGIRLRLRRGRPAPGARTRTAGPCRPEKQLGTVVMLAVDTARRPCLSSEVPGKATDTDRVAFDDWTSRTASAHRSP